MTKKDLMQICSGDFGKPEGEGLLGPATCSTAPFDNPKAPITYVREFVVKYISGEWWDTFARTQHQEQADKIAAMLREQGKTTRIVEVHEGTTCQEPKAPKAEADKCDLVCANCHRIRTRNRRTGNGKHKSTN